MLPLTQSHLTLLEACPRRYQHVFFDARSAPSTYEQHTKTKWGSQFHLLMQQQALGLPIDAVSNADANMAASLDALAKAAPEVFEHLPVRWQDRSNQGSIDSPSQPHSFSQSEHRRILAFNDYLLTVVYDLVVLSTQKIEGAVKGHIFDWKTHQTPPPEAKLKTDWQTRLYQYVLCETAELAPEQISMTYWFVRLDAASGSGKSAPYGPADEPMSNQPTLNQPILNELPKDLKAASANVSAESNATEPSSYRFSYSLAEHDRTRRDLLTLTDKLTRMRRAKAFPKVDVEKGLCDRCPFAVRCDRLPPNTVSFQSAWPQSGHSQSERPQSNQPKTNQPQTTQQLLKTASQITADSVAEVPL